MTRFIRERLRPISLPRRRCLDRSAEASDGEVKALRAVTGSLSWIARQCRPDEAGTASTLQGSVTRAVVKDLSDANRACGTSVIMRFRWLIAEQCPFRMQHSIWIARTVRHMEASRSVSPLQHFTNRDQQSMSPMSWSSYKVKRSVSASLAGEVFMMSEGLAECEWISGVLESVRLSRLRTLITSTEIDIITRRAHGDRREGGQRSAD